MAEMLSYASKEGIKVVRCTKNGRRSWSTRALRCMCTPPNFSSMFSKGDNFRDFLVAYLEDKGSTYFLYKMIPIYMGGSSYNDRVVSPSFV